MKVIPALSLAAIFALLQTAFGDERSLAYRGAYYVNGEIHINTYGQAEKKPLTSGHHDFKPSWSKTGNMLVFFRRIKNDPEVSNWKTAIHVIKADGSELHTLSDGTHTDFNQTWTRDGKNTPIWNRKHPTQNRYQVIASKVGNKPGQEVALTNSRFNTWAFTCLTDGRILVLCNHPEQGRGYYLMTPGEKQNPRYERIDCDLANAGILARLSLAPDESKVCFEFQRGFKKRVPGRVLYLADFDSKKRTITNLKPFANESEKPVWFAYPRWSPDGKAIVYHAGGKLFLYTLKDGSTQKVSTNDQANYRYPHMEATPK